MPLILLTGFPASGKSTRAYQLKEYFSTVVGKNVLLLSENDIVKNKHIFSGRRNRCCRPKLCAPLVNHVIIIINLL